MATTQPEPSSNGPFLLLALTSLPQVDPSYSFSPSSFLRATSSTIPSLLTLASMSTPASASALQSSIRELCIGEKGPIQDISRPTIPPSTSKTTIPKKKKNAPVVVADSWEDEMDDSASDPEPTFSPRENTLSMSPLVGAEGPLDPPPTPISPQTSNTWTSVPAYTGAASASALTGAARASPNPRSPTRRPEKQTAVAGRMIAGALGLRAPKRTEEQRSYDRAVKEQEIRRRNREREEAARAQEEEEKVKASIWND